MDARSIVRLVIPTEGVRSGPKDFVGKPQIQYGYARGIPVVTPREISACQQGCPRRAEVSGRTAEQFRCAGSIRGPQLGRVVGKETHVVTAGHMQWWSADQSHSGYTRNRSHGVDHALLHGRRVIVAVTGHAQIGIDQHRVLRVEAEVAVE